MRRTNATTRLDRALVDRGLAASRSRAQSAISQGAVHVNGALATKASMPISPEDTVEVEADADAVRFVGRGALKLEAALALFDIDVSGRRCCDLGASTGGFTHCLLLSGASTVYAVDVGHDQLADELRRDERVVCMEGVDARDLSCEQLGGTLPFVATDVSFISLRHVLPTIARVLDDTGEAVCLVKPQFEAGPSRVGKNGVVKDPRVHRDVIRDVLEQARASGLQPTGLAPSPITGQEGNVEYLLHLEKKLVVAESDIDVESVVRLAHETFG